MVYNSGHMTGSILQLHLDCVIDRYRLDISRAWIYEPFMTIMEISRNAFNGPNSKIILPIWMYNRSVLRKALIEFWSILISKRNVKVTSVLWTSVGGNTPTGGTLQDGLRIMKSNIKIKAGNLMSFNIFLLKKANYWEIVSFQKSN